MKRLLLLITIIANSILLNAQGFCLTGGNYKNQLPEHNSVSGSVHIKVYFHLVTDGGRSRNVQDTELKYFMNILNKDFGPDISFDYYKDNDYYDYIDDAGLFDPSALKDGYNFGRLINTNPHADAIDIYLLTPNVYTKGYVRASGIPGTAFAIGGGNNNMVLATSHVLSHGMAHCLGLFHTYHGTDKNDGDGCAEHVNRDNGTTCGDYVWDTSADPHITSCYTMTIGKVDENGDSYDGLVDWYQIMADVLPDCMSHFSNGQMDRMKACIATSSVLKSVVSSSSITYSTPSTSTGGTTGGSTGGSTGDTYATNLYIKNRVYDLSKKFTEYAYDTIFAGPKVTVESVSKQEVRFEAGKAIVLKSGFRVEDGAYFMAKINRNLKRKKAPARTPEQSITIEEETDLVSPIQETSDFSVSPNPAHNEITIHCSTPVEQVAIYNLNGQVVLQSTQTQIDLSALSQGVYIVRVLTTDGQVLQAKVLHE